MSIPVEIDIGNADPEIKTPPTINEIIAAIRPLLSGLINEALTPYVIGQDTPSSDDQDKAWIRLGPSDEPLGTYTYLNGFWVPETPGVGNEFGFFFGDPATYFDGTGRGLKGAGPVAGSYYGWALMNGNNGTLDMSDKFLAMAHMNNDGGAGYNSGWEAKFNGVQAGSGGEEAITPDTGAATGAAAFGFASSDPVPIIPPYQAVALIQFVGYSY